MRLVGQIHVTVQGNIVQRDPTFFEKMKRGLGGKLDLSTDRVKVELEATATIDAVKRALGRLGVSNALSLVIDDTVIFQDTDGKADDLPDLVIALSEHASVFGRGFRELRFAAEHEEAGLHLIVETRAKTEHKQDEPSAIVSIGGRLRELEPQTGESAEAYRQRVEPLTKDTARFEAARLQFESFVGRLEIALQATLPQATVEQQRAEARLVRTSDKDLARREPQPLQPHERGYDPFMVYYPPSPMSMMLDMMIISSFMHALHPPHILVMTPGGAPLGPVGEVAAKPEAAAAADDDRGGDDPGADDPEADGGGDFGDDGGWDS